MKSRLDALVLRRLAELSKQADEIEAARTIKGLSLAVVDSGMVQEWATSVLNLLQRVFGEDSAHYANFHTHYEEFKGTARVFHDLWGVFKAAKQDYEGGYIFRIRALIGAELLNDALEQAADLLKEGYKDPAAVVARVALETTLKELGTIHNVPHAKLARMNVDLRKAGVYNLSKQQQITAWADVGNNAAHGNWSEYSEPDVEDMITGINRFIADYL